MGLRVWRASACGDVWRTSARGTHTIRLDMRRCVARLSVWRCVARLSMRHAHDSSQHAAKRTTRCDVWRTCGMLREQKGMQ
mmetsp:Transcript_19645/g.58262  ORF Transcript_19645/g.58262 Transcript_19645/m.58262 type:complete len:81 (+) Transcript_19645:765-1007(+)